MSGTEMQIAAKNNRWLFIPFIVLAIICIAWTGFWYFASGKLEERLDIFMSREAAHGRVWNCPNRAITGFPFGMRVNCTNPSFTSNVEGKEGTGKLANLTFDGRAAQPNHVIVTLESPFQWQPKTGAKVEGTWKSARLSLQGKPQELQFGSLEMTSPIFITGTGENAARISAESIEAHLRASPQVNATDKPGTDIVLRGSNIVQSGLDVLAGNNAPTTLEAQMTFPGLIMNAETGKEWRNKIDLWRDAGGMGRLVLGKVQKGNLRLEISGPIGVDKQRRLSGRVDGKAFGMEEILGRFGVKGANISGILGALFGKKNDGTERAIPIMLRFEQGQIYFGPFAFYDLEPLY